MSTEIKVPVLPESVADATVVTWHKKAGETVKRDETLVDLETDKVVLEVPAPSDGVLGEILKPAGSTVTSGEVLATLTVGAAVTPVPEAAAVAAPKAAPTPPPAPTKPAASPAAAATTSSTEDLSPSARRRVASGEPLPPKASSLIPPPPPKPAATPSTVMMEGERPEKRVPMSRLRARIAERLLDAKNSTAMLTSFNEVNMEAVITARNNYREAFEKKYNVRLGFLSFFVHAVVETLKHFPVINASIDGNDIIYHGYYDIGIAVSTDRGLVVPVIRDADKLTYAEIEQKIVEYSQKARSGQLTLDDIKGGTFTITNGGVFGSLLSTPIVNPPQSAILGLHKIMDRPIAEHGQVVIKPMMYLALSYDHRIIDGKEAVQFLVMVKQFLEDPARALLDI